MDPVSFNIVPYFDAVSAAAFAAAIVVTLLARTAPRLGYGRGTRVFLVMALSVYFLVGISNVLEHAGVTSVFDPYEDYLEILFSPAVAYSSYFIYMTQQLTERERAESMVRNEHNLLTSVIDTTPAGIIVVSGDGRIPFANDRARAALGLHEDDHGVSQTTITIDGAKADALLGGLLPSEMLTSGDSVYESTRFGRTDDGQEIGLLVSASPVASGGGDPWGMVVAFADITEREMARRALADSEARYRLLFESNPIPMWVYDVETLRFLEVNDAAVRHYGYTDDEFLAMTISDIRPAEDVEALQENVSSLRGGLDEAGVWRHIKKDGTHIYVEITSYSLTWGDRRAELVLAHDVTERVRLSEELARYRQDLERVVDTRTAELIEVNERLRQANRAKNEFLANVSHELRTPLNSIIGFSDVLLRGMAGELNEEQGRQLEMIHRSSRQLLALVNDVLDLSRLESGRSTLRMSSVEPDVFVHSVVDVMRPLAEQRRIDLRAAVKGEVTTIQTDEDKLGQIVRNLVSNAVKFTDPPGGVTLEVSVEGDQALFLVNDTGIGIDPDELERIFEPFHQIDTTDRIKPTGTGLGLAICRDLTVLLGGKIGVSSDPGKGSSFWVRIPVTGPEAEEE